MDYGVVVQTILLMGLIIFIGFILAIKVKITKDAKDLLITIIINIAIPFIILNGVFNTEITDDVLQQVIFIFCFSLLFNVAGLFISLGIGRIFRFELTLAQKLALLSAIGNTAFIAIPLCIAIFGPIGGLLAAVFDAGMDMVIFTVGVYLLRSKKKFDFKQLKGVLNIPLFAILFGMVFVISGLEAPLMLKDLSAMLSSIAAPLGMLYIGMLIPAFFVTSDGYFYKEIWFPLGMKLLIFPVIIICIMYFLPIDTFLKYIAVILTSMPTFMLAPVLFSRYTDYENKAAMTTIYSTLLSLITIPSMIFIAYTVL